MVIFSFSDRQRTGLCLAVAAMLAVLTIRHSSEQVILGSSSWREIESFLQEGSLRATSSVFSDSYLSSSSSSSSSSSLTTARDVRVLHYHRHYQYILPASRYDYNPYPAPECGVGPAYAEFFHLSYKQRSRANEDSFIYQNLFLGKNLTGHQHGRYVEMGAYDGSEESNTHFFNKCLGWKGLLIEENPDSFKKVVTNRPFAHKMSLAPSCSAEYERVNKTIEFYRYPLTNVGLVDKAVTFKGRPTVPVPCGPLGPILQDVFGGNDGPDEAKRTDIDNHKHNKIIADEDLPTIDFFSLDVEGAESTVLDTIDFHKVRIHVLMIEIKNHHCQTDNCLVRKQVRAIMARQGYLRYQGIIHASDLYIHPNSPHQLPTNFQPTHVPDVMAGKLAAPAAAADATN